jgi:cell division protein FtsQ
VTAGVLPLRELPAWRRWVLGIVLAGVAGVAVSAPWWGPRWLTSLSYFRVREVVFDGLRYVPADSLLARLALRSDASVWDDLGALEPRIAAHPAVHTVHIARELPARLHVVVTERVPVALAPSRMRGAGGTRPLAPFDADGSELPIDPQRVPVDAPILARADSGALATLDRLRREAPRLYRSIEAARPLADGGIAVVLDDVTVLAPREVPVARWLDIFPVLDDLARRGVRAREIDLRFKGQVVARVAAP